MPNFDGTGPFGNGQPGKGLGPCGRGAAHRGCGKWYYKSYRRNRFRWINTPNDSANLKEAIPVNRFALETRINELEDELKWYKDLLEKEKDSNGKE
jgi:hypothetical protein